VSPVLKVLQSNFLAEQVLHYLQTERREKKPLLQQLSEMYRLTRYYRYLPYQYLKHELYLRSCTDDIYDFMPQVLLQRYIQRVNPKEAVQKVKNKSLFTEIMRRAGIASIPVLVSISRDHTIRDPSGIKLSFEEFVRTLRASNQQSVFIKPTWGVDGLGAFIASIEEDRFVIQGNKVETQGFFDALFLKNGFDDYLVQPVIRQHDLLDRMNPTSVNTVRISTLVLDGEVFINGAVLRIGSGETCTDNWSRGGFMTKVDLETGELGATAKTKPPKYGRRVVREHPKTGFHFEGARLPFWTEAKALVSTAARVVLPLKHVGWDVVFTKSGPLIMEGNHPSGVFFLQEGIRGCGKTPLGQQIIQQIRKTKGPSAPLQR